MLRPMSIAPVPSETARVARAAFPKGNRYLRLANVLRLGEWLLETTRAKTRLTPFARLMVDAPAA
jgi:hypothetical protein